MQQSSNDSIIMKSSLGVKQTSIGEGPKVWKYLPFALVCYHNIEQPRKLKFGSNFHNAVK